MIERSHLQILKELNKVGTITETANRLHLTQSALSHSIKKLESQFEVQLWEKDGRKLRLTQAGKYMVDLANRLIPQLENAENRLHEFASGQQGSLRIGMECHPCYQWLLGVVKPYLKAWPGIELDVKQQFQFGGLAALINYDIDLLITPDPLHKPHLHYVPIFDYELVLACSKDNLLSQYAYISPEQLSTENLLTYPVTKERLDIYSQFLLPNNTEPKKHRIIENTDIMMEMVSANRGVTALPVWLAERYCKSHQLEVTKLGKLGIHKQLFVGMRQSDEKISYIKGFLDIAKQKSH